MDVRDRLRHFIDFASDREREILPLLLACPHPDCGGCSHARHELKQLRFSRDRNRRLLMSGEDVLAAYESQPYFSLTDKLLASFDLEQLRQLRARVDLAIWEKECKQ